MPHYSIKGLKLEAVDTRNNQVYKDYSFDIVKLFDGYYYGIIEENSTERQLLELRVIEESK